MNKEEFLKSAQQRLSGLSGEAYTAELARVHAEMDELVKADAIQQNQSQLASIRADYARIRRTAEAQTLAASIARPGCANLVADQIVKRVKVEPRDDGSWDVVLHNADGRPISADDLKAELRAAPGLARLVEGETEAERAAHAKRVELALGGRVH